MGGIEYNSVHLAEGLDPDRFEIIFLCPGEGKLPGILREKKIPFLFYFRPPFFSTSLKIGGAYVVNPFAVFYNFISLFFIASSLSRLLKKEKFGLIVTKGILANFYGSLASKGAGIRSVWDMQEIVSKRKCFGVFLWMLNAWAFLFAGEIMVSSEAMSAQFWKVLHEKISVIPNGVDTDVYAGNSDPSLIRKEWNIEKGCILIGHIARLTYWKGQKDFLDAASKIAAQMPDARFAVVGSPVFEGDAYEKELKAQASRLGLEGKALFPGFRDDLKKVLAALDIFVHSSVEPEGCPITLITAMAMEKSCVVTDVPGNSEIVEKPDQAILIPPHNPEKMADAVLELCRNADLARRLGQNARRRILQRYSLEAYIRNCSALFSRLAR